MVSPPIPLSRGKCRLFQECEGVVATDIDETDKLTWLAGTASDDWEASAGRWAFESHNLAEKHAYTLESGAQVGEDYVESSAPIAELRLSQAGIRLAAVLEECLGPDSVTAE